jgi:hypothetical protein
MWVIRRLVSLIHTKFWNFTWITACRIALFAIVGLASGQPAKVPRFEEHRVSNLYRGPVSPPQFGRLDQYHGTDLRCFGRDPAEYTKEPANFAGHFVIHTCTCGTGCYYLYMWDALSGMVYLRFPAMPIDVGPFGVPPAIQYKGEEYRLDSSLLVLEGCIEETCDCARRYYNWNGSEFKLVLRQPTRMPPSCTK